MGFLKNKYIYSGKWRDIMRIKIIMDSGKEYIVSPKQKVNNIDQFVWIYFEKNNALINKLITLEFDGEQFVINPTHISSMEMVN
ncbi:hypothetical protein HMPREF1982_04487 [Clostridiales bacterium oral taxon 876 str. F0540]|nr:hypothetical protein HMPREF1982_04487 [Clostridiales bacterium oral taxon 876 str. F0540]